MLVLLLLWDRRSGADDCCSRKGPFLTPPAFVIPQMISFLRRGRNLVGLRGPGHVNADVCDAVAFLVSFSALPSETA